MDSRRCYRNIGQFAHARGFLSEIILPPEGRDRSRTFHDSWSDSCLGRVLHQLWERRTPPGGYGCGGGHDYFRDILNTVTGLDHEFNKLEHFLFNSKIRSVTTVREGESSAISANYMSYLDFAATSLLELICGLKQELTVQVKVGSGDSFGALHQTNKLVSVLENKLHDLLGKLDELKISSGDNLCCKRCYEHATTISRPLRSRQNCPWKNNVGNLSHQYRCLKNVGLDYLPANEVSGSLIKTCRNRKTGFQHRKMNAMQPKFRSLKNTQNHNISRDKNEKLPSDQWNKSGFTRSKTSKDLKNTFVDFCGRSNNDRAVGRCPKGTKSKNSLQFSCGVKNKNNELGSILPCYEKNRLVHASSRPTAHSQLAMRKRAGKDGSADNSLSEHRPGSHNSIERYKNRETFMNEKQKQYNHNNTRISQPSNQKRMWTKRVSFNSTSSDQTSASDDGSDSPQSIDMLTGFKNAPNRSKYNLSRSRNKGTQNIGKGVSYTNIKHKKHTNKQGQRAAKNNNVQSKIGSDSLSSDETSSTKHNYISVNPNRQTESHVTSSRGPYTSGRRIRVNKHYAPPNKTTKKTRLRRKPNQIYKNKLKKQKPNSRPAGVYARKSRGYRKQRPRSNRSKAGNFLKRVGNQLSKIRIFSSKPRKHKPKSGSSKSTVRKFPTVNSLEGYKRIPKRKQREYTNSSNPSRNRIRSYTKIVEANSLDSGNSSSITEQTCSDDYLSASSIEERNSGDWDYPYFFERIPSYEYDSDYSIVPEDECQLDPPDIPIGPQYCDVCPLPMDPEACDNQPPSEDRELADEYEIIFEKVEDPKIKCVRPKKIVRKVVIEKSKSTLTLSTESSPSSESVSSALPENKIIHQQRKYITRLSESVSASLPENKIINQQRKYVRRLNESASASVPEYQIIHRPRRYFRRINERENVKSFLPEYKIIHQSRKYVRRFSEGEDVSLLAPEYKTTHQPRKTYVRRNRFRNLATMKKNASTVAEPAEEEVRHSRHKRRRKYIRIGSQKFQEVTENVIDYDYSHQPQEETNSLPTVKITISRGTSTELFQPSEEIFTFQPPVKDTLSRGTSTEALPLYAKRTSTSDLIKLIKAIGTNTEQLITRDTGIDPIPLKQKTPPVVADVKTKFTNTDQINVRSTGTDTVSQSTKPPVVHKATDPLFYTAQKDNTTNTVPEKKKDVINVGTDPRPTQKLQLATKATDPLYYLGQQVKFTNTEAAITTHAQTETPKRPTNVSIGTATDQVKVQDQKTSFEKVKTSSRGNNPILVEMSEKGFQFDTVELKPVFKTAYTETFIQPSVGKSTQTSFTEKPKVVASVYEVQTQTEKLWRKPPPPILKQRKPSILSEEVAVVEAEESSVASPSELSMHLVFEKCQEDIYKRRTNICNSRCCGYKQKAIVCDNIKSRQIKLNSSSDCNVSPMQKDKSPYSELELTFRKTNKPLMSNFASDNDLQTVGKIQNPARQRKPKLAQECGVIYHKSPKNNQKPKTIENLHTEPDEKSKSNIKASVFDSSYTTLTSCDWRHIAKEVKLNN